MISFFDVNNSLYRHRHRWVFIEWAMVTMYDIQCTCHTMNVQRYPMYYVLHCVCQCPRILNEDYCLNYETEGQKEIVISIFNINLNRCGWNII